MVAARCVHARGGICQSDTPTTEDHTRAREVFAAKVRGVPKAWWFFRQLAVACGA